MAGGTHKEDREYLCDLLSLWNLNGTDLNQSGIDISGPGNSKLLDTGVTFHGETSPSGTGSNYGDKLHSYVDTSVTAPITGDLNLSTPSYGNDHTVYLQHCASCNSINDIDSNWCCECGTVLLRIDAKCVSGVQSQLEVQDQTASSKHSGNTSGGLLGVYPYSFCHDELRRVETTMSCKSTSSVENGTCLDADLLANFRTSSTAMCEHVDASNRGTESTHISVTSAVSQPSKCDVSKIVAKSLYNKYSDPLPSENQPSCYTKLHSSKPSSQLNIPRHWSTSSMYMWRKPSSLETYDNNIQVHSHTGTEVVSHSAYNVTEDLNQTEGSGRANGEDNKTVIHVLVDTKQGVNGALVAEVEGTGCIKSTEYLSLSTKPTSVPMLDLALVSSESPQPENTPLDTGLMYLPDELLLIVLLNLHQTDLYACMFVCKRLYSVALDLSLWNNIEIRNCSVKQEHLLQVTQKRPKAITFYKCSGAIEPGCLHVFYQQLNTTLEKLQLTLCDFSPTTGDGLLLSAAYHCPNLSSINIDWTGVSEDAIVKCIHTINRLEELYICRSGELSQTLMETVFNRHGQWLKRLEIYNSSISQICETCESTCRTSPNLISLSTKLYFKARPRKWRLLHSVFPNLKHLFVYYKPQHLSSTFSTFYLDRIPLVSLSLKFSMKGLLFEDGYNAIAHMNTLRHFATNYITDDCLYHLCNGELKLISLEISDTAVTRKSFEIIRESSFSQTLVELKFKFCFGHRRKYAKVKSRATDPGMNVDQEIKELKTHCKSLRRIEL